MQKNIVCVPKPITSLEYVTINSMMLQYLLVGLLVDLRATLPTCTYIIYLLINQKELNCTHHNMLRPSGRELDLFLGGRICIQEKVNFR